MYIVIIMHDQYEDYIGPFDTEDAASGWIDSTVGDEEIDSCLIQELSSP